MKRLKMDKNSKKAWDDYVRFIGCGLDDNFKRCFLAGWNAATDSIDKSKMVESLKYCAHHARPSIVQEVAKEGLKVVKKKIPPLVKCSLCGIVPQEFIAGSCKIIICPSCTDSSRAPSYTSQRGMRQRWAEIQADKRRQRQGKT